MPKLTRWFIRTALAWLVVALSLGVLVIAPMVLDLPTWLATISPVYIHLLMVGWVTQLIFGVAYWMFPKATPERASRDGQLGWLTYFSLNAGLLLRAIGEPLTASNGSGSFGWMLVVSALLQLLAGWLFVATAWPRVRER